jgi:uncharacterized protein
MRQTLYPANAYLPCLPALVERLTGRPQPLFAMLFGSAAAGEPFHDIDIALWVDRTVLAAQDDLAFELAVLADLAKVCPYPLDVRVINDAPLGFRYNVSKGKPLVINDEELYFRFLERTWDDWLDFKPVAMQYIRELA